MGATNAKKLRLVLWKNALIQWRHKVQTAIELLVPVLCVIILVILRVLVEANVYPDNFTYASVAIDSLDPLRQNIGNVVPVDFRVVYAPQSPQLEQLVSGVSNSLGLTGYVGVANAAELQARMLAHPFLAGIEFNGTQETYAETLPTRLAYALRFPGELRTARTNPLTFNWQTGNAEPVNRFHGPRARTHADGGIPPGYAREGFAAIQHSIADHFLRIHTLGAELMPRIRIQRFPHPGFRQDSLLEILEELVPIVIVLSYIYPCINTIKVIAVEKERQLKEAMKIMGMPNWIHWIGWFVRSLVYMTVSISLFVMLAKVQWGVGQNVAVFTYTDWTLIWLFMFVYSIATITFCFMMSVFFSKANLAASVAGIVWFAFYLIYVFVEFDGLPLWSVILLSIFHNTGMAFGYIVILRYEGTGEGSQWSNLFQPHSVDNAMTLGYSLCMQLVSALVYMLIALYVEHINPGEYGVPKPWYFPVTRSFWCGVKKWDSKSNDLVKNEVTTDDADGCFEDSSSIDSRIGIQIRKLRKVYSNGTVAVSPLTLDMFEDQITVLLGHNGSGKTTTMSMLTGMLPPTSGTAYVNGYNIRSDIDNVRGSIGFCPQHNILFDELTVSEHIEFYAALKGTDASSIEQEISKFLKLIQLEAKRDVQSTALSGGMKRKLSVCVAFCGGSKVVFLDEPSSGMDPAARRALWDVIQAEKPGRTVLLSTHFMDEADVLADRIAIINSGELKCSGSSYFLKKRFGTGYHLICAKGVDTQIGALTNLLRKYIPDVSVEHDIRSEIMYSLPSDRSDAFEGMFNELERQRDLLGLDSYGISLTTLEEVFLKVGTETSAKSSGSQSSNISVVSDETYSSAGLQLSTSSITALESGSQIFHDLMAPLVLLTGTQLIWTQTAALFKKRFIQTYRSWVLLIAQVVIPAVFALISIVTDRSNRTSSDLPRLPIELSMFGHSISLLQLNNETTVPADSLQFRFGQQYNQLTMESNPQQSWLHHITEDIGEYVLSRSKADLGWVNRNYYVGAAMLSEESVTVWFNNQPYHGIPLALQLVHTSLIRAHLGQDYAISVTNAPLPYGEEVRIAQIALAGRLGLTLAVNVAYAMAFVMAFFVLPYVREFANRAKLLQLVSGAKVYIYWTTAFIWDYMLFLTSILLLIVVFAVFQEAGWATPLELSRIALMLAVFGFSALPLTHLSSRMFSNPTAGYTMLTIFFIMAGLLLPLAVESLRAFDYVLSSDILTWIFMLLPHFALNASLRNMQNMTQTAQVCETQCALIPFCDPHQMCMFLPNCCGSFFYSIEEPGIGTPLTYLVCMGILCIAVNYLIEYDVFASVLFLCRGNAIKRQQTNKRLLLETNATTSVITDADVLQEQKRVDAMTVSEIATKSLVMQNVSKLYGSFQSVNRLSIAIDSAECFGLLGVNGAGKTSTFKMMIGDLSITDGEAWVNGISLRTSMSKVHARIGYCPQFDALIEEMTCRQVLTMFCRLRGVHAHKIHAVIATLAAELNFGRHLDKLVQQCSGGNKRKVSTAVALIGNPVVVYLDEPTTGMDPGAKRHLWDMVNRVRGTGTTIVLTSHSMDECEALCTRLAIMVGGQFKCLGSLQHLKNKFSKGYTLVLKCTPGGTNTDREDVKAFVQTNFEAAELTTEFNGLLSYHIPGDILLSTMFGRMHLAKQRYASIEDFTLSQTTLEQVFLAFAQQQFSTNANDEVSAQQSIGV